MSYLQSQGPLWPIKKSFNFQCFDDKICYQHVNLSTYINVFFSDRSASTLQRLGRTIKE